MPGYKETDLGVIPEDWDVMPLADVCSQICDGTHFTPQYVPQGVPFYSVENVTANDFENTKFISEEEHSTLIKRCKPERGDILMTRITAGVVGDTRIIDWDVYASIYVSLALLKPNNRIESEYLYRYSRSTAFVKDTEKRALTNATPKKINMQDIGSIPIPVPKSTKEQRAIATALSDVDSLLDGLDRLIAKKRDIKQAAMQQLLTGKTRLPGFEGEWTLSPLESFVKSDRFAIVDGPFGSQLKVTEYVESGVPVIEMEHLLDCELPQEIERYITSEKFATLKRSAVYPGDILISKTGTLGKLSIVPPTINRGMITSRLAKITLNSEKASQGFIFQCLIKLRVDGYWEKVSQGGTMQILGIGMLKNAPIPNITVEEQSAITNVLADMDTEIEAIEKRRAKTRDLKQAMMQELLTGRTRLI